MGASRSLNFLRNIKGFDMSKSHLLLGLILLSCCAFTGCGSSEPQVIETEPQTEQDLEDYDAQMDAGEEIAH